MNKYIVNYHYFSDGFTYFIIAPTKWQALLKGTPDDKKKMISFYLDKDFIKIYDIKELKQNQEL